eukprot:g8079.t1
MLHEHALRHAQTERLDVRLQPSEEKSELKQGKLSGQSQSSQVSHSDRWADAPVQDDKNSTIHSIQTEGQGSTTEELARIREQFGLNKPKKQSFTPKEDEVPKSPEPLPKPPSPPTAPSTASDVGIGRGHLDLVWSEHEFNDGDKENRRVLKKFTKEFKKMAEETPEGIRKLGCTLEKCLQDLATLRCKQHRQADAAELLEELAQKAPPHPATFINLGTVYNQLRQYDKAESWFHQAVNLKGGTPEREDIWNLAICKKNMGQYEEALPMFEEVLREFQVHEPHHPVTIAKVHSSLGGCLHEMGRYTAAAEQFDEAYSLYASTVGRHSPLFGGLVMSRAGKLLSKTSARGAAERLLREGRALIQQAHDAKEANLAHEILEVDLLLHGLQEPLKSDLGPKTSANISASAHSCPQEVEPEREKPEVEEGVEATAVATPPTLPMQAAPAASPAAASAPPRHPPSVPSEAAPAAEAVFEVPHPVLSPVHAGAHALRVPRMTMEMAPIETAEPPAPPRPIMPGQVQTFRISVPPPFPGVQIRKSTNIEDKHDRFLQDGKEVRGKVDASGQWVKLKSKHYLPVKAALPGRPLFHAGGTPCWMIQ